MKLFNVNEANREPSVAINIADRKGMFMVPDVSDVKDYGRKNNLDYSVPRFLGLNHYYMCTRYIKKKGKNRIENWTTQINPLILSTEGLVFVEETQHGVEGTYLVPRHPRILVAYTEAGSLNPIQRELIGLASLQFQQAIHAVNGLFISDFGLRIDDNEEYKKADDEGKAKIAQDYFKALKESYEEEMEASPETKEYVKATEWAAEQIQMDNARQGVLPGDIEKQLNEGADKAESEP